LGDVVDLERMGKDCVRRQGGIIVKIENICLALAVEGTDGAPRAGAGKIGPGVWGIGDPTGTKTTERHARRLGGVLLHLGKGPYGSTGRTWVEKVSAACLCAHPRGTLISTTTESISKIS